MSFGDSYSTLEGYYVHHTEKAVGPVGAPER